LTSNAGFPEEPPMSLTIDKNLGATNSNIAKFDEHGGMSVVRNAETAS
jgi:hypothetical protein